MSQVLLRVSRYTVQLRFASHHGTLAACANIGLVCEAVLHRRTTFWCVSIDFSKLFNVVSCQVAGMLAGYMGLSEKTVKALTGPLLSSRGFWRLPLSEVGPFFKVQRGVPQALSASVLLSECFLAGFIWRLHHITKIKVVAYIDDIYLVATSPEMLDQSLSLLQEFQEDFGLSVSREKTFLWGSEHSTLVPLAEKWGYFVRDTVVSLGTEWALHPSVKCSYDKEQKRLETARARLARLVHLASPMLVKAAAILTGCLSLLDYSIPFKNVPIKKLRNNVRRALGLTSGAPEVVFGLLSSHSLDPLSRWCLVGFRFWHSCARLEGGRELLSSLRPGRALIGKTWETSRAEFVGAYKLLTWMALEKRRPSLHSGLNGMVNTKNHRKLLKSLDPLSSKITHESMEWVCHDKSSQIHTKNREQPIVPV